MKFSFHHTVRISPCPKNKPAGIPERKPPEAAVAGFSPVQTIYPLIRLAFGKSQPPDCVPPREAIPDILHGSYLLSEQSPASSHTRFGHNLPTRLTRITKFPLAVKREFCIFYRFFSAIFVQNRDCGLADRRAQNIGISRRRAGRRSAYNRTSFRCCNRCRPSPSRRWQRP